MSEGFLHIPYYHYDSLSNLTDDDKKLVLAARNAANNSYSPYSSFPVGAALRINDTFITGSNQENASYPEGLCAERVAIYYAGHQFPEEYISAMAVSVKDVNTHSWITSCGGCRQAILEYEDRQNAPIRCLFDHPQKGILIFNSMRDMMPMAFLKSSFREG